MLVKSSSIMPVSFVFPLKVQTQSKLSGFIEWFENFHTTTNPETGRKRKGNVKKFLFEELEILLTTGKVSTQFSKTIEEFKQVSLLSPEIQQAKQNLSESDFLKFIELMEKVKNN